MAEHIIRISDEELARNDDACLRILIEHRIAEFKAWIAAMAEPAPEESP